MGLTLAIVIGVAVILLLLVLLEARRMSDHHEECCCEICRKLSEIKHDVRKNHAILIRIEQMLEASALPTDMTLTQIGDTSMAKLTNNSIVAGTSGTFQETNIPAGSVYPAGTVITFATSDPTNVTVSASPDGDPTKTLVNVPAGYAAASFQLGVQATGTDSNGNPFTVTGSTPLTITVTPATPPSNLPTDMSLAQLA
jgi:hypothetical protein